MATSDRICGQITKDVVVIIVNYGRNGSTTPPSTIWKLVCVSASEIPMLATIYEQNICLVLDI
ncbi:hypothetical protein ACHAO1_005954 [Botrytis cinerea]